MSIKNSNKIDPVNIINPDRLIVSGKFIELYKYQHPPVPADSKYRRKKKRKPRSVPIMSDSQIASYIKNRSENNLHRARSTVRRIIDCNSDIFIKFNTLTFADLIVDLDVAHLAFRSFIKRLKYFIDNNPIYGLRPSGEYDDKGCSNSKDLKYIAVVEFMPSQRVHYHFLSNTKFIDNNTPVGGISVFANLWGQGFVKTNKIYRTDSLGAYVSKYLYKDFADDRLVGRKAYFTSRELIRPQIFGTGMHSVFPEVLEAVDLKNAKLLYESEWTAQYQGQVLYQKFYCGESENKI